MFFLLPSKAQQPGTVSLQRGKHIWVWVHGSLVAPEPGERAGSRQGASRSTRAAQGLALPCPGMLELLESTSSSPLIFIFCFKLLIVKYSVCVLYA